MKRCLPLGLLLLCYLFLMACATHQNPTMKGDLTQEMWRREVDVNPRLWALGADNWFFTGDPNATEVRDRNAPYAAAISTMQVNVPDFTGIRSNGDFQVQIFGTYGHNTVYVYGPNDGVREVNVEVRGNTLCIGQSKKSRRTRKVIVRIAVNQLTSLVQLGCGPIEAIQIRSGCLDVESRGSGNIYLSGNVNLRHVVNAGVGNLSVFGAQTAYLDIKTLSRGSVNVSGHVGVRAILHHGVGNINIIGATTAGGMPLTIYADGAGKIGINGNVSIREIKAKDRVSVYAYPVMSDSIYVYAHNKARVGLAGSAGNIYVDTFQATCFQGRFLCADNAFVRAHNVSHINISARSKIFAAATENSSVYFFGTPNIMSQFVNGGGVVIPVWGMGPPSCPILMPVREARPYYPRTTYHWKKRKMTRFKGEG